uniref:Large ribosomal subunit protein P2 n=1 Tax=Euplotes raikovi TaxID=5938 RepID=RLA2_EUPRA|nr:RecName: Full=Large ribosomal subunit protein P2; AltName: Full=60S acidic ribosomal protein P2 [Euplotes raikovi]AAG40861.1 P2 acidic ribosomal protein [Euplotes raikovi]
MKYIAAYALLVLGGNSSPSADDVKKVLKSVGVDSEQDKLDALLKNLEGKQLHELIEAGSSKVSSLSAGAGPSGGAAAAGADAGAAEAEKEEEPQEEEADVNMGDIFGGDDEDY